MGDIYMSAFNVLYLSSEITPFAKVGGLGDVANSLPRYLKEKEHDIRVLMPKYKMIRDRKYNLREVIRLRDIEVPLGNEIVTVSVKSGFIPESKVQAYFLEYKPFYDRPDVYVNPEDGEGWPDNHLRFALFARTAFEMLKVLYWQPDLIHVNDWPSALVPYYLKTAYKDDPFFENIKTVMTIHNQAYQGEISAKQAAEFGITKDEFDETHPGWNNGNFNFLKAGIKTADIVTTVSPSYAKEIVSDPEVGCGLGGTLKKLNNRFIGILNGIDDHRWDPETDQFLEANYSLEDLAPKRDNRKALCEKLNLECSDETMLIGMVSRLASQKGFDIFIKAVDDLLEENVAFVILTSGHPELQKKLEKIQAKNPARFAIKFAFDRELAHLIEAGSDVFLMPSKYEPCGLNQMYSQRYGTPPIVHATGGLKDTVEDYKSTKGTGTGFVFKDYSEEALVKAVQRASKVFQDKKAWSKIMKNGMMKEFGWDSTVNKLLEIYSDLAVAEPVS